jgi:hypothetical protein
MANEATSFSESSRTVFGNKHIVFGTLTTFNGTGTAALELNVLSNYDFVSLTPTNAAADDYGVNITETFPKQGAVTITPTVADQTYVLMAIGSRL